MPLCEMGPRRTSPRGIESTESAGGKGSKRGDRPRTCNAGPELNTSSSLGALASQLRLDLTAEGINLGAQSQALAQPFPLLCGAECITPRWSIVCSWWCPAQHLARLWQAVETPGIFPSSTSGCGEPGGSTYLKRQQDRHWHSCMAPAWQEEGSWLHQA